MPDDKASRLRSTRFRVGDFAVDPGLNRIEGPEGARQIEPRAMQVLCVLYERAGETVGRDELLREVWAGRVVVDETLTRSISQLRQAFGDGKREPRYIQTVSKRGYRLIAETGETEPSVAAAPAGSSADAGTRIPSKKIATALVALLFAGIIFLMLSGSPERLSDRPARDSPSVAVLPFEHLGAEFEGAYLADGVTEEILNALATVPGLRVPSRHSAFAFRDKDDSLEEIARRLKVRHILEGSVRRSGDELKINARLIDVSSDTTLWSRQFDGDIGRIFAMEEEIAGSVIEALAGSLPSVVAPPSRMTRPRSVDAYSLYLQGNYWWMNGKTSNWFYQARDAFEKAIELDPEFAEAHGSLAYIYARHDFHDQYMASDAANQLAEQAIERALALDEEVVDAYHARAILATSRGDFPMAERALDRALDIRPQNAIAHNLYSELHLARNEPQRALRAAQRALRIDPLSAWVNVNHAIVLYHGGRTDDALAAISDAVRIDPEYTWAFLWQAVIRHARGDLADAVASMTRCLELDPASETNAAYLGMLYLELMDEDQAQRWFEYAASLYGDSNAARFWARFVPLVSQREDDAILLALTRDSLAELHNARYSLVPVLHGAAVRSGDAASFADRLVGEAPDLRASTSHVRPQHGDIALALAAMSPPSAADRRRLLRATGVGAEAYPKLYARRGLAAQRYLLDGDEAAAIESLERALERGWLHHWWLVRQSPIFDPLRETPGFTAISERVRRRARAEAAKLPGSRPGPPD